MLFDESVCIGEEALAVMNGVALITGSAGLVGSESVRFLYEKGLEVHGIDNDLRKFFFGEEGSTDWNRARLEECIPNYRHHSIDIRNNDEIEKLFRDYAFDLIIHAAAQPSHDWAARDPFTDFGVNANGTLVLLENYRKYCPNAIFIFVSTNKVYGDRPNFLPFTEMKTRFDLLPGHPCYNGIDEKFGIDNCKHSIFGVSKLAADILTQEYGKYFGLKTGSFRGGCLTGPAHSGVEMHGFLAYLSKCIATDREYTIYGYKGKQVRDNIHAYDFVNALWHFYLEPRCGEIYNMGGSRHSNISILEAISYLENVLGKKAKIRYTDANRMGDHIWYISDIGKFRTHYPQWEYSFDIYQNMNEICKHGRF